MQILQPAEWSKPRGFSHGVVFEGPGKWMVLAGQTGGDEKGEYPGDMAARGGTLPRRIVKLLGEGGARPGHIRRLTLVVTRKMEFHGGGAGTGAALNETVRGHLPPAA